MRVDHLNRRRSRQGFTMVELLIVLGIILVLASILAPALSVIYRKADKGRTQADFEAITTALNVYRNKFGDYPRAKTPGDINPMIMARALIQMGQQSSRLNVQVPADGSAPAVLDHYGNNVQYIPLSFPTAKHLLDNATTLGKPVMYDLRYLDAKLQVDDRFLKSVRHALGDTNMNNQIDGTETLAASPDFILISSGPEKKWSDGNIPPERMSQRLIFNFTVRQ